MNKNFHLIDNKIADYRKLIKQTQQMYGHMAQLTEAIQPLEPFFNMRVMMMATQILVCVRVSKIKDIEPLIASLQDSLGIEFDKTRDQADLGWREFNCEAAPWLRVDAELTGDGPDCRRVIVGYETVPKYEIKCGEEASQPDAPKPEYPF